jgi:hypothetical protein
MLLPDGMSITCSACSPVRRSPRTTLTTGCPCRHVAGQGCHVGRGHGDRRAGPARGQPKIAQHQGSGHDLGQAGDGHRPAAARRASRPRAARPPPPPGRAKPGGAPTRQHPHPRHRCHQGHRAQQVHPTHAATAATMTAPAVSTRDRTFRPRSAPRRRSPGRPGRHGRLPPRANRGRNSLRRITHDRNNPRPPGPARLNAPYREPPQLHGRQQPCCRHHGRLSFAPDRRVAGQAANAGTKPSATPTGLTAGRRRRPCAHPPRHGGQARAEMPGC